MTDYKQYELDAGWPILVCRRCKNIRDRLFKVPVEDRGEAWQTELDTTGPPVIHSCEGWLNDLIDLVECADKHERSYHARRND